VITLAMLG